MKFVFKPAIKMKDYMLTLFQNLVSCPAGYKGCILTVMKPNKWPILNIYVGRIKHKLYWTHKLDISVC